MAVKANAAITVAIERDIQGTWRFYRIASSANAPTVPTEAEGKEFVSNGIAPSGWSLVEPAYDGVRNNSLYTVDLTAFTDGSVAWTGVSKSSSYEASKDAATKATNYLSSDETGVMVADMTGGTIEIPSSATGRNVFIDSDSVDIRDGQTALASFGETVTVGKKDGAHILMSSNEIRGDSEDSSYFSIDSQGAEQSLWVAMGSKIRFPDNSSHTIDLFSTYGSNWENVSNGETFKVVVDVFSTGTSRNFSDEILFTKGTPAYWPDEASYGASYDGVNTITVWTSWVPSGSVRYRDFTTYYNETRDTPVYRFGNNIAASGGPFSFLIGEGTKSNYEDQLVMGKYNNDAEAALIIGNGTSNTARSNALTVDWSGNIAAAGNVKGDTVTSTGAMSAGSLTLGGHSSAVGDLVTASPSESEASATDYVTLTSAYLSLTAGTWIITYSCYCDVNSASKRLAARLYNRTSGTAYNSSRAIAQTSTTAALSVTGAIPVTFEGNTSIALQAYQNSGSAKTISGYMRAVRIA